MKFIKIGQRVVNLQNVKLIELIESSQEREIRFYFIDGSYSYCTLKKDEKDENFEIVWYFLNDLKVLS